MSSTIPHDDGDGRVIAGRYALIEQIGRGGLGSVWRARDKVLDRVVAVKEIALPAMTGLQSEVLFSRVEREARAAARLQHPNVVVVHDVLVEDDRPWIVMEYVAGRSLQDVIDSYGPMPPRRAAEIGLQTLSGLRTAHAAGILHRDVKPSNILITEQGQAKLTDFGVAQIEGAAAITQTGMIIGSPPYMAPERLSGERATPASDLWSLGATLYAAVEGRPPFRGSSIQATMFAILTESPPRPRRAAALTPLLEGWLTREPTRRMATDEAMRLLSEVAGKPGQTAARIARGPTDPSPTTPRPFPPPPPPPAGPPPDHSTTESVPLPKVHHRTYTQQLPQEHLATETVTDSLPTRRHPNLLERFSAWIRLGTSRSGAEPAPPPTGAGPWTDPATRGARSSSLYAPLHEHFRYIHEPLQADEAAIPLLSNERLIQALKERLTNSRGGAFLVTGFRGVGKTTLVERALAEMANERPRGRRVLPVIISVARPMPVDRLLFAIVRRVFEELKEAGVLEDLPAATRQSLVLAYMRTSLSFRETHANAWERSSNIDVDLSKIIGKPMGMAIPKTGISTKRSRSLATEAAFLAYSETDVEHDMMRIVRMLSSPGARRSRGRRRLMWWRRPPLDLQLVVVFDEVDKLTAAEEGLEEVERLLGGIKNVVTMRGAHYLMVAGPDLYDQVLKDSGRGNSLYESIFAWRLYVPCSWSAPARLLENLFLAPPGDQADGIIDEFEHYLRFKSRGVPRRLLHELNSFVVWEETGKPYLRISSQAHDAISLYAQIERALDEFFVASRGKVLPTPIDQDRWRLSGYYVMDWILRSEGRPFTSADVLQSVEDREIDPLLGITRKGVDMLLTHLAERQILHVVRQPAQPTSRVIGDITAAQLPSFKLTDILLTRLLGIAARNEGERAELDYTRTSLDARISGATETIANRYELLRHIGEGGTSTVYEGRDILLQRPVAVKMLRSSLSGEPLARRRFLREARITEGVHHPNVVAGYEVVTIGPSEESTDRQFAIVMELLTAPTLDTQLREDGPMHARDAVRTGITLTGALDYLADKGLARIDLKPSNIVMTTDRGPVIIDLGIAKVVNNSHVWLVEPDAELEQLTGSHVIVGTPAYAAPEQINDGANVDIRSDIYSLGLVLYTCLTGRHPYEGHPMVAIMASTMTNDLDASELPCSPELRQVITRATTRDRSQRFQKPAELLAALRNTPEA